MLVGAGAGPQPYYTPAKIYLAGPYYGGPLSASAPVSVVIITPAVAGPFDLGTVVTRAGLYLDPAPRRSRSRATRSPASWKGSRCRSETCG